MIVDGVFVNHLPAYIESHYLPGPIANPIITTVQADKITINNKLYDPNWSMKLHTQL